MIFTRDIYPIPGPYERDPFEIALVRAFATIQMASVIALIVLLIGCAASSTSREIKEAPQHAAAVMGDTTEAAQDAENIEIIAAQAREKTAQQNLVLDLWWTLKYVAWGQGSKEEWPWFW